MPLIELFKNYRDKYMRSSVEKLDFPEFPPDEDRRYQIVFSGRVQGVGFRYEAMLIAENETNSVCEYTAFQDAIDAGKTRKTWNTMIDKRVRHTHADLEGVTIPIMERFMVGAYEMYQPKDSTLGAGMEEIAGCRCWCTYS